LIARSGSNPNVVLGAIRSVKDRTANRDATPPHSPSHFATDDLSLLPRTLRSPPRRGLWQPYLSVANLMKRWPQSQNRRQIILMTDGIDRVCRGPRRVQSECRHSRGRSTTGTMVHTIYLPGVGHWHGNFWQPTNGQNGMAKLSGIASGESFSLGTQDPIRLLPYLMTCNGSWTTNLSDLSHSCGKKGRLSVREHCGRSHRRRYGAADAVWIAAPK
jgi:hypothetical protein